MLRALGEQMRQHSTAGQISAALETQDQRINRRLVGKRAVNLLNERALGAAFGANSADFRVGKRLSAALAGSNDEWKRCNTANTQLNIASGLIERCIAQQAGRRQQAAYNLPQNTAQHAARSANELGRFSMRAVLGVDVCGWNTNTRGLANWLERIMTEPLNSTHASNAQIDSILVSDHSSDPQAVSRAEVLALYNLSFPELMFQAQSAHRRHFDPTLVQISTLISIKTGGCPEKCDYCPQSAHFDTGLKAEKLMRCADVLAQAEAAKAAGATRFCMGAAWRGPKDQQVVEVAEMVRAVKAIGMETCATLGLLQNGQAEMLKNAGLDYYNHNLDTAPEYYAEVIGTRTFQDRLDTLGLVRSAGLKVCSGGIVGMDETREQRAGLLQSLANLPVPPESVPINLLVKVEGTPMAGAEALDPLEFVRTIAVARLLMPKARVRLSAGRQQMSDELQTLCFLAGANSIFYGDKLLTTENPEMARDLALFARLGMQPERATTGLATH